MPASPRHSLSLLRSALLSPTDEIESTLRPLLEELGPVRIMLAPASTLQKALPNTDICDVLLIPSPLLHNGTRESLRHLTPPFRPAIIVIGSEASDAQDAFDIGASDFFCLPFDLERCRESLFRLVREASDRTLPSSTGDHGPMQYLPIRQRDRITFVRTEEIDWIEACGMYVKVHARSGCPLIRRSLHDLSTRLDQRHFVRIHRSTIINLDRLKDLKSLFNGDMQVTLMDGTTLTMSRRFRPAFSAAIGEPV